MAWKHAHGFYGCDLKAPYYSQTSAEPPVVISSPAYQLPELKSRAQAFAEAYRELHDLPFLSSKSSGMGLSHGATGRAAERWCAMTFEHLTLRILISLACGVPYLLIRNKQVRQENERRAIRQRVEDVIRGSQCI